MKLGLLGIALFTVSQLVASEPGVRLGNDVVPLRQSLTLDLDPATDVFRGRAVIEVRLTKPASTIWLNATELEVDHP
jgi:alanyl aminopeptidase